MSCWLGAMLTQRCAIPLLPQLYCFSPARMIRRRMNGSYCQNASRACARSGGRLECDTPRLWPTNFSGSVASKYESRLQLLDRLEIGTNPALIQAVNDVRAKLAAKVEEERRSELAEDRAQSGRFE